VHSSFRFRTESIPAVWFLRSIKKNGFPKRTQSAIRSDDADRAAHTGRKSCCGRTTHKPNYCANHSSVRALSACQA
jgi:hypothetical protein